MEFKNKITKLRLEKKLTQVELAKELFVSRSTVSKWEQGRGLPSLSAMQDIANYFNITIDELITDNQLKAISLDNNRKVSKNTNVLYLSIALLILILVFMIILFFKQLSKNDIDKDELETLYTEIIEISNEKIIIVNENTNQGINIDIIDTTSIYNNKHEVINYSELLKGDFIKVEYSYKDGLIKKINKIQVIDSLIENNIEFLGFFVSTEKEELLELPKAFKDNIFDYNSIYKYPYFKITNNSTHFSQIDFVSPKYIIGDENNNSFERAKEFDIVLPINYYFAPSSYVRIYILDTSERGFYLYETIDFKEVSNTIINITGSLYSTSIDSTRYDTPFTVDVKINLTINNTKVIENLVVCEYDKNHDLIIKKEYSSYEEFVGDNYSNYVMDSRTIYIILEINYISYGAKHFDMKMIYIADEYEFLFSNSFGYVQKINCKFYRYSS